MKRSLFEHKPTTFPLKKGFIDKPQSPQTSASLSAQGRPGLFSGFCPEEDVPSETVCALRGGGGGRGGRAPCPHGLKYCLRCGRGFQPAGVSRPGHSRPGWPVRQPLGCYKAKNGGLKHLDRRPALSPGSIGQKFEVKVLTLLAPAEAVRESVPDLPSLLSWRVAAFFCVCRVCAPVSGCPAAVGQGSWW